MAARSAQSLAFATPPAQRDADPYSPQLMYPRARRCSPTPRPAPLRQCPSPLGRAAGAGSLEVGSPVMRAQLRCQSPGASPLVLARCRTWLETAPRSLTLPPAALRRAASAFVGGQALAQCVAAPPAAMAGGGGAGSFTELGGFRRWPLGAAVAGREVQPLSRTPAAPSAQSGSEGDDEPDYSEPSADLQGLLEFLDGLSRDGMRLTEMTYVVNRWTLAGLIPLRHHGFIVGAEGRGYLTLDFSRRGILWDTFDAHPDYPEGTFHAKKYDINVDPKRLRAYCQDTTPFAWPGNDCAAWSEGLIRTLRVAGEREVKQDVGLSCSACSGGFDYLLCGGGGNSPFHGCFA